MLDLMNKMTQLSEAKEKTKTGLKHTAEPGGYGRKDDEDDEGHKVKAAAVKKGKGRPKKDADDSGETKKYDFSAFGVKSGKDVKLPKHDKKKTTVVKGKSQSHADNKKDDGTGDEEPKTKAKKKGLKEYFDALDKAIMNEDGITVKPMPGASQLIGPDGKPMGTADAATANTIKAASEKGTLKLGGEETMEDSSDAASDKREALAKQIYDLGFNIHQNDGYGQDTSQEQAMLAKLKAEFARLYPGEDVFKIGKALNDRAYQQRQQQRDTEFKQNQQAKSRSTGIMQKAKNALGGMFEEDIGKHNNATTGFDALVKKLTPKYGVEAAKRIAGAQMKKIKEADMPPNDSLMSPIGEGKKGVNPFAKKDTKKKPDADKDGVPDWADKKKGKDDNEGKKKGAAPKKGVNPFAKKKVKESMEHTLKAARHMGKAHALAKQNYNCNYDDMEEARQYHDGFKEGLDECHGQMPIQGYVGENNPVVNNMASYGAHTPQVEEDMYDEGNAFTGALARTPNGGKFSVGGKSFTDHSTLESTNPFDMNEDADMKSWDSELNSLLNEDINEGLTVSSSTGQQGSPDSVSINATDADAQELLAIVRQAGLGVFGGDEQQPNSAMSQPMTVDGGEGPEADIEVVDDHDGMLSLIRKMTGQGEKVASDDYADEEGDEEHEHEEGEETCSECGGMMEEGHSCGEAVEEDDSMDQDVDNIEQADDNIDQAEEEVAEAEDAPVDDNVSQAGAQQSGEDAALAQAAGQNFADTDEVNEEELEEGYANGNDDNFEADIDFMTKVISGGVNKQKSTGQSTIPVVSTQIDRLGNPMKESTDLLHDWKALSGIK